RRTVSTLQSEIEAELDLAETRQQMQKELAKIRQTEADMRREMAEMRGNMKAFESSQSHSLKASNEAEAVANDRNSKANDTKNHQQSAIPNAFDYSYATDKQQDALENGQLSKRGNSNDDSDMAAPVTQILNTRPWENMWFRLGAYDKARRLPMPPYLPNYKADTLLNSSVSTQTSDNKQGTD
ncbi:Sec-independent protein translocase protein TatB, partial [Psychrobacter sp. 1Y4]|uniref:Sec-independent protein translocase protein TatB n=1 Tax=Psychrobacter sp. 1Y4 TaxID=3453575 RepID=UPI003F488A77